MLLVLRRMLLMTAVVLLAGHVITQLAVATPPPPATSPIGPDSSSLSATATSSILERGAALVASSAAHNGENYPHPEAIRIHGTPGVNYDLDRNKRPFIWCERYNLHECQLKGKTTETECTSRVQCFPERNTHRLGCMAVLVYNESVDTLRQLDANSTAIERLLPSSSVTATLKDCWSQDESELRECVSDERCVVGLRKFGDKSRAAKFCCCKSHGCNKNLYYAPPANEPASTTQVGVVLDSDDYLESVLSGLLVVFLFICVCVACCLLFYSIRRRIRSRAKLDGKQMTISVHCSSALPWKLNTNSPESQETAALVAENGLSTITNIKDLVLLEKTSSGRFGQVHKARYGESILAVKIFPASDVDSWINEQEIYSLKTLRASSHIASFVDAFQQDKKFWLLTVFYENGSLFDYLKRNMLDLEGAWRIISSFLGGLAFLHEEIVENPHTVAKPTIVHRDLKSKNVLIRDDHSACIADFGLALKCDTTRMSADENHGQVGTRRYMSPELLEGATEFTSFAFQQIDVYAAALVLWEILSRTRVPEAPEDEVPEFLMPYERETGVAPSLGQIRELVVIQKYRPQIRASLYKNEFVSVILRTMLEMWDMEPDGRITSGCARDRLLRVYEGMANPPTEPTS